MVDYRAIGDRLKPLGFRVEVMNTEPQGPIFILASIYKESNFLARMMGLDIGEVLLSSRDEESFSQSVDEFYSKVAADYKACGVAV